VFKYGKKKPQGATRQVPKSVNSSDTPPSSSVIPSWLLVGFGSALGLFVAFVLYMWQPWQPSTTTTTPEEPVQPPPTAKEGPRFEFYDLLPNQKVNTPATEAEPKPVAQPKVTPSEKIDTPPSPTTVTTKKPDDVKKVKTEDNTKAQQQAQKESDSKKAKEKDKLTKEKTEKDKLNKAKIEKEKAAKIQLEKDKALAKAEQAKAAESKVKYTLQAGSFKNAKQADQRRASISMSGLPVKVLKVTVKPGEDWYRVVVGPFTGKDKTTEARQALSGDGIDSLMVKQDKK
jgi:type IV secretory pathway VirB10-like protein